jgi:hypothetical protein
VPSIKRTTMSVSDIEKAKWFIDRTRGNEEAIAEYAELYREQGGTLPPVRLVYDGKSHYGVDGKLRVHAARLKCLRVIPVEIASGTRESAVYEAIVANATHGVRRTNADKREAVQVLFRNIKDAKSWSAHRVAEACAVSQPFVSKLLGEMGLSREKVVDKRGREMEVANIGRPAATVTFEQSGEGFRPEDMDPEPEFEAEFVVWEEIISARRVDRKMRLTTRNRERAMKKVIGILESGNKALMEATAVRVVVNQGKSA